ncbi:MAG TPA: DUF3429 domain-containing protein [Nevskiaceae bacterium]|nr:DUF3429 domain-containing protein [Nevskiaceae bacterium]
MQLSPWASVLGLAGLIPFFAGPLGHWLAATALPAGWDGYWIGYASLIASFMAGTQWGLTVPTSGGGWGLLGLLVSVSLMLLTWAATALPFDLQILALIGLFLLLLITDAVRERLIDSLPGYFRLRLLLTSGAVTALAWRALQG